MSQDATVYMYTTLCAHINTRTSMKKYTFDLLVARPGRFEVRLSWTVIDVWWWQQDAIVSDCNSSWINVFFCPLALLFSRGFLLGKSLRGAPPQMPSKSASRKIWAVNVKMEYQIPPASAFFARSHYDWNVFNNIRIWHVNQNWMAYSHVGTLLNNFRNSNNISIVT